MKLKENDIDLITETLEAFSKSTPLNIRLTDTTEDSDTAILRYTPLVPERDAVLGILELERVGLNIDYDGDPTTQSFGPDFDADPMEAVIMVKAPLFDPSKVSAA